MVVAEEGSDLGQAGIRIRTQLRNAVILGVLHHRSELQKGKRCASFSNAFL